MEYAVLYYSESGNTEELAKHIYTAIDSTEKSLINLGQQSKVPQADVYFVGFPIHQNNCGIKVVDALEQIESGKLALFATCGITPTATYQKKLEETIEIWIADEVEYLGMFLCQGRIVEKQREVYYNANPEYRQKLEDMFDEGDYHPNRDDYKDAVRYVHSVLQN
jgi:flavodoxin